MPSFEIPQLSPEHQIFKMISFKEVHHLFSNDTFFRNPEVTKYAKDFFNSLYYLENWKMVRTKILLFWIYN